MERESAETLADRGKVKDGYALVNAIWKSQGYAAALTYCHHLPHGRALPLGLDLAEINRVLGSMTSFYGGFHDWPTQWFAAGDEYYERGRKALAADHRETAAQMLFSAACCYHLAGYMHHDIGRLLPETQHSLLSAAEVYWEAAPYFTPPAERVDIPFDDTTLPTFLRLPPGRDNPPCVVMIGGANSHKINMHAVSDYYLARGMAALGVDGPGQGEFRARTGRPLRMKEFDRALSAAADWLIADGRVDEERLGIYGRATGGMLAIHAVANDKRFKAVAAHPASFNWANFFEKNFVPTLVTHRLELCSLLGAKTLEEGTRLVHQELTLEDVVDKIDFPILTVCSANDETMPASESELLRDRVKGPVEVVVFPGKGHGGPSRLSLPLEADWMMDALTKAQRR
jgi:2,6-dihydroxypseudooxynicotine hydrolase